MHGTRKQQWILGFALLLGGCSDSEQGGDDLTPDKVGEPTEIECDSSSECDDGSFCNGVESCRDGVCHLGVVPTCDDGIECTEDSCSHLTNGCVYTPPDKDGDGFADASCRGPADEALGEDCDDEDSDRFPGNPERCSIDDPTHDEDCDPKTFGLLDEDQDGFTSDLCCNTGSDDESTCGTDCDDSSFRRYPEHPEICDDIDNDCDGRVDKDTKEVLWYPDLDGDNYGEPDSEGTLSCAPIADHALRATDCDDVSAAVHSAAREICDGADNDCDGEVDEDGVCACAPEGNARACACSPTESGVQLCDGGRWQSCDCQECVTGTVDCLGDLLPRECVAGRWVIADSCKGQHPICLEGSCVCADGSDSCADFEDLIAPSIVGTYPVQSGGIVATDGAVYFQFSESMDPLSFEGETLLRDSNDQPVPGELTVIGNTMQFRPAQELNPGGFYSFNLSNGATDLSGNPLPHVYNLTFETMAENPSIALSQAEDISYSQPSLSVSPQGQGLLLAVQTKGLLVEGVSAFDLVSDNWVEQSSYVTTDGLAGSLGYIDGAVADSGQAIMVQKLGNEVRRFDYASGSWGNATVLSTSDSVGPQVLPALSMNAPGEALITVVSEDELNFNLRSSTGTYSTVVGPTVSSSGLFRQAYMSQAGRAACAHIAAAQLQASVSGDDVATWNASSLIGNIASQVQTSDMVVDSSGTTTFVWNQDIAESSTSRLLARVQEIDAAGNWLGSPAYVAGQWNDRWEDDVQIGIDGNGHRWISYAVRNVGLFTVDNAGQGWSEEQPVNVNAATISQHRLLVNESGDVVLVWLQRHQVFSLWAARWTGSGWSQSQLLENQTSSIVEFDAAMDDSGTVRVVFESDQVYTTQF